MDSIIAYQYNCNRLQTLSVSPITNKSTFSSCYLLHYSCIPLPSVHWAIGIALFCFLFVWCSPLFACGAGCQLRIQPSSTLDPKSRGSWCSYIAHTSAVNGIPAYMEYVCGVYLFEELFSFCCSLHKQSIHRYGLLYNYISRLA